MREPLWVESCFAGTGRNDRLDFLLARISIILVELFVGLWPHG